MTDLVITNVRPLGAAPTTISLSGGRIAAIGGAARPGDAVLDAAGALALPGLIEAHTHLDKSLVGMDWYENKVGPSLADKIDNERAARAALGLDPRRQSERLARLALSHGSTQIRSHVDIDTEIGVRHFEGVLATRDALRDQVGIQTVAFPQSGLLIRPGTLALMEDALRLGADVVGGLDPCAIDRDPKGHLDAIFGLAERFGRPLDIHLHEPGEMGAFSIELIVERTRAHGMSGRVAISHAFCLGMVAASAADALIAALAEAGVAIVTTAPPSRPAPPLKRLLAAGVLVAAGSDGVRDTWGPYGNADMLERAMLLGLRQDMRRDDELAQVAACCMEGGARLLGIAEYGLAPRCIADLVLVDARNPAEAIVARPPRRSVIRGGRVVVREGRIVSTLA